MAQKNSNNYTNISVRLTDLELLMLRVCQGYGVSENWDKPSYADTLRKAVRHYTMNILTNQFGTDKDLHDYLELLNFKSRMQGEEEIEITEEQENMLKQFLMTDFKLSKDDFFMSDMKDHPEKEVIETVKEPEEVPANKDTGEVLQQPTQEENDDTLVNALPDDSFVSIINMLNSKVITKKHISKAFNISDNRVAELIKENGFKWNQKEQSYLFIGEDDSVYNLAGKDVFKKKERQKK